MRLERQATARCALVRVYHRSIHVPGTSTIHWISFSYPICVKRMILLIPAAVRAATWVRAVATSSKYVVPTSGLDDSNVLLRMLIPTTPTDSPATSNTVLPSKSPVSCSARRGEDAWGTKLADSTCVLQVSGSARSARMNSANCVSPSSNSYIRSSSSRMDKRH